jgi:hypothetical protein
MNIVKSFLSLKSLFPRDMGLFSLGDQLKAFLEELRLRLLQQLYLRDGGAGGARKTSTGCSSSGSALYEWSRSPPNPKGALTCALLLF